MRGRGVGVAIYPRAHFGEIRKIVCRAWNKLFARLRNRLSAVLGFCLGNFCEMFGDQVTEFA